MAVTAQELGRRIRAAREACRMTQDDVANELGMSRSTVAQMELGNRNVTGLELDRLAYLFGRDLREFVAEAFHEEEDPLAALFRAEPEIKEQSEVMQKLRQCVAVARELRSLERLLAIYRDTATAAAYELPAPKSRWDAIQQGERVADNERRRVGLGSAPVPRITEVLETQGVLAAAVDLPDDVSGLTVNDRRVGLFIVANARHHVLRRRFSFAHEYAHVLFDRRQLGAISRVSERDDLLEVRANSFAACFLMPEEGVRQFAAAIGKGKPSRLYAQVFDESGALPVEGRTEPGSQDIQLYDLVHLGHYFGVSRLAALYRLRNLRIVTEVEFERLKTADETGKARDVARLLDLPEREHANARTEFRHRLVNVALEAFRRELITRAKLIELGEMVSLAAGQMERLIADSGLSDEEEADVLLPEG